MKLKKAFQYQLASGSKLLGWTVLWIAAAIIVVPIITTALVGRINSLSVNDFLPVGLLEFSLNVFLIFYSAVTYDGFQNMIQNGIGRKTYFYSKTLVIGLLALVGSLVSVVYNLLVSPFSPVEREGTFSLETMYYHFFSNGFMNHFMPFVLLVLLTICIAATFMFIGSILGLFERRTQIALIIGVPIVSLIAFMILASANEEVSLKLTWIVQALMWIAGETGNAAPGELNPFQPLISGIVYSIIMFAGAYFFNLKLKTPR